MKRLSLLLCLLSLGALPALAQVNMPALQQMQAQINEAYKPQRAQLVAWAKERQLPMRWKDSEGREIELVGVDELGMPVYVMTDNTVAAASTATNRVYPGGILGYNLTGQGMTVGEWDGGATRLTHQELAGRSTQVDGATTLSDHATHVAGTMIAAGVQPNARGMAYQANLATYDWNNDNAEMAAAAQNGLLVSNHSYGQIAGWHSSGGVWYWYGTPSISETLDWNFGFYNSKAQQWDQIAVNNPFYLIVKSAGNNRNQGPNAGTSHQVRGANGQWTTSTLTRPRSGPYDCLPTYSVAKNILTIGAVNDLPNGWQSAAGVGMSSFSSWGPTDDGRIKPDIVGNGVGLYSSYSGSNTAYSSISGTSMSGPNVAGSLILIQQRYQQVHNRFMRSSTLKALAIHTADEAGPELGPDYMFGWGLLNTGRAVQLIDNVDQISFLEEHTLEPSGNFQLVASHPTAGPLRVSIAWTDPAGTPPAASLNPTTRMLVNDLDLRLIHLPTNTVYSPWILNPAVPAAAADRGDNNRDNVEQVFVANAPAGEYRIVITHKGTNLVGGSQQFGLVVTGLVKGVEARFTAANRFICAGDSVRFSNSSVGASQFSWSFPGGSPATDTTPNPVVRYLSAGVYPVQLVVNGQQGSDTLLLNNYVYAGTGLPLPFGEDFETAEPQSRGWTILNPDTGRTWTVTTVGGSSPGNRALFMDFFNYQQTGQRDAFTSPPLNLTGLGQASLRFSHAYRQYNTSTNDSLRVLISTNCGQTWTPILAVGGSSLATMSAGTTNFVPSATGNWCGAGTNLACFNLPLNAYVGQQQVFVRFEAINRYGNNLYIDNIVVDGVPNILPNAQLSQSSNRICAGGSVQFSDQSTGLTTTRTWLFPGGNPASSTDPQPLVSYSQPGTYSVQLIVQNAVGNDTLQLAQAVVVDSLPPVSLAPLPSLCSNSGIVTLTGGLPAGGYYSGTGVIGTNQFDPSVAGAGLHDIVYTFTQNGCTANATAQITVTATPQPQWAQVMPQCVANAAFALTQGSPAGGTYSGPGVSNNTFDPAVAGVGSHSLSYTLVNGSCSTTVNTTVVVTAAPQASMTALNPLCSNASTQLLVGQPLGGNFSGPGVNFGVFNPAIAGAGIHTLTYTVVLNGCSSVAQSQVEVTAAPQQPSITAQGATLLSSASAGNQWFRNGQAIAGAIGASFSPTQTGNYQVQASQNGCASALSAVFEVINVSTPEERLSGLRLYPNPASNRVVIAWDITRYQPEQWLLFNTLGQEVARLQADGSGNQEWMLPVLPAGSYTLKANSLTESIAMRLLIQH